MNRTIRWSCRLGVLLTIGVAATAAIRPAARSRPRSKMRFSRMPEASAEKRAHSAKFEMLGMGAKLEEWKAAHGAYPGMRPLDAGNEMTALSRERIDAVGISAMVPISERSPDDPFSAAGIFPFAYHTDGKRWILFSPGPDGFYDFHPERMEPARAFNPAARIESTYDPTNGVFSAGDIFQASESKSERPS